ncbi:MAG TPA: methyltransferase domain-containing protein [Nitrospirae bacterium]|nr:methyltransferase domain-containing protein [Nitrospirota bacterium]
MEPRKNRIMKAFSRSASTYDAYTDVQKVTAANLIDRCENLQPKSILEIGCATGNYTLMLADRFPSSPITSIDFSEPMIKTALLKLSGRKNIHFICNDAEDFAERIKHQFDLITSNATLQWFSDLDRSLREIADLLSVRGSFLCSIFGSQTFYELGLALSHAYGRAVALPAQNFPQKNKLLSLFSEMFSSFDIEELNFTYKYTSALQLLRHIRNTGTSGGNSLRPLILTRSRINAMDEWFTQNHKGCAVTYQVFSVKAVR